MTKTRPYIAALLASTLAGCNLAPHYRPPATVPIPAQFKEAPGWSAATPSDAVAKGEWWLLFNDPVLDGLEREVTVSNQTVAQFRGAYEAAGALVREQRAALFPQVTGQVGATENHNSSSNVSNGAGSTTQVGGGTSSRFSAQLGATWAPDLFGKLGNGVSQARAQSQASEGDLENAVLAARVELATDYLQLRGFDAQRLALDQTVTAYTRALAITRNKYNAGTVAHSDVYQAQTSLANAEASRRDLDRQRALLEHAIAVLAGKNPSTFAIAQTPWNPVVPQVPSTIPSDILQRRPDIAAAERRVAAANANVGIQRAAFFPQFNLNGSTGLSATSLGNLFSAPVLFWSLGLSGVETLLDFGANKAKLAQARAQFDQAAAVYRQAALTAFQQTEDNLAAIAAYADVSRSRDEAAASADKAEAIARNQYLAGLVDYTTVVTAQNSAFSARQTRIVAVVNRQAAAVALVQAIGGSWAPVAP